MGIKKIVKFPSIRYIANLPSPFALIILVFSFMIFIFTLETLGLSNREVNLKYRETLIDTGKCY